MKWQRVEILLHLIFWMFSFWMLSQNFAFETLEVQEENGVRKEIFTRDYKLYSYFAISLLAKIVLAYANIFWVFPGFLKQRNWSRFFLRLIIIFSGAVLLEFALIELYVSLRPKEGESLSYFRSMWQLNVLFYLLYYGFSVAYVLAKNWWKNEKLKEQLIKEKLTTELDFLKTQINPHFLFNTLNNLFTLAERKSNTELASGISELSNLMRYMLYDCKAERVSLEKELTFLRSIIEIHGLKISDEDELVLAFEVAGNYEGKMIAPLILVPFVENAFKHGIDQTQGAFIKIGLKIEADILHFEVRNSVSTNQKTELDEKSGIGLENVKRRLELIYPEKYTLNIQKEEEVFKVYLQLELI